MTLAELNERFSNAAQAENTLKEPNNINLNDYLDSLKQMKAVDTIKSQKT